MPSTAAPVLAPRRRLSRRLLGSSLAEALATPHGVDRYLELVRPSWSLREVRAEIEDVLAGAEAAPVGVRAQAERDRVGRRVAHVLDLGPHLAQRPRRAHELEVAIDAVRRC